MNNNKRYLLLWLFLFIWSSSSAATAPVEVKMQFAIDKNCDGVAEQSAPAIPGACVIYTLTLTNHSTAPIHDLQINGQIPEHTRLYQSLWLDHDIFAQPDTRVDRQQRQVTIKVPQLAPGKPHAIVLQYAVKIEN